MANNNAVYANIGTYGVNDQPSIGPLMQAQSGVLMLFTLADLTGAPIDLSGLTLSGTITNNLTSETAALVGALAIVTAEDGIFSWLTDADDVGTAGEFTLVFQAGEDIISLPAHLSILETPGASVTFGAALMGVTAAERAWLTAALAAVPDASGLPNPADELAYVGRVWKVVEEGVTLWSYLDVEDLEAEEGGDAYDMLRKSDEGKLEYRTPEQVLGDIGAQAALPEDETEWLTEAVDSLPDASALQWVPNPADAPPGVKSILTSTGAGSSGWFEVLQFPNLETDFSETPGDTRLLLWDVDAGALVRVSVGADDSGGTGYKVLRIPNG